MKGSMLRGHNKNVWISPHRLLELDRGFPALLSWFKDTEVGDCLFFLQNLVYSPLPGLLFLPKDLNFNLDCGSEDLWLI